MSTGIFHRNFPHVVDIERKKNEARYIIGLDLHKKTTAVSVIDVENSDKPIFQRKRINNEKLLEVLNKFSGKKMIVAEASYGWVPLKEALKNNTEITLVLFDPRKTSAWIETSGIKSDTIDAEVLAYACFKGAIARLAVHQSGKEARENFKLAHLREQLVRQRTRVKNQLKALARYTGTNPYTGEISEKSATVKTMEDLLLDQLNFLQQKIGLMDRHIKHEIGNDSVAQLFQSIPGIGTLTAYALRNKIEDIRRFEDARHLCSYFGFGVRQHQSGDHVWKGKITKTGNSLVRKLLVQGAQVVRYRHPEYLELYFPALAEKEAMKNRRHANKVVIALARKQLIFVFHCWNNKQAFSLAEYQRRRNAHAIKPNNPSPKAAELV